MLFGFFTGTQIYPLILSVPFIILSVLSFHIDYKKTSLILLFIGSLGLGYFIANLDPFLNLWDEQFHALVAKNLLKHPFIPTLYANPILEYDYRNWIGNHIWLHKQPLFLWQIAISLKLFGINELAVRIPSIMLHAITAVLIYRIGKISNNDTVGYYGALFFSVAYYPLELIAGKYATDHNDIAFLFYITASFWAWFEYQHTQNKYWILLIGIFSGCAVLVKWLVGLLIYAVWTITIRLNKKQDWFTLKTYYPLFTSLGITLILFLPWQFYCFYAFPLEAKNEFLLNVNHFSKELENHGGDLRFHFLAIKDIYGSGLLVPYIILLAILILIKNSTANIYRVAMIVGIIIVYAFYSIAATKMTSFCLIVSPFIFLGFGILAERFLSVLKKYKLFLNFRIPFSCISLLTICFFLFDFSKIQNYHTNKKPTDNRNRNADISEMALIQKATSLLHNEKYVIFNTYSRVYGHIPVMFYTDYIAYDFVPSKLQIEIVKMKSYKIAIVATDSLPQFLIDDSEIIKIK